MTISPKTFSPGKLPHEFLDRMLKSYTGSDARVILGSQLGEDAAVIDMGQSCLLAKTDPITFVSEYIGYYAVHVNANDICCMGGDPRWFLATVLLPEKNTTPDLVESIFKQIQETCRKERIVFCGGHTEITLGLDRPIIIGQMLGEVTRDQLILKRHAKVGDRIILARPGPIEATAIIAREKASELSALYSADLVRRCQNLLFKPGLSVRPLCRLALAAGEIHAFHDPTEGGLYTGLHELATAAQLGVEVHESAIPLLPEGKFLCDHFELNPYGCIASGSLLIVTPPESAANILANMEKHNIVAADIGYMTETDKGKILVTPMGTTPLPIFEQDEIVKIFT